MPPDREARGGRYWRDRAQAVRAGIAEIKRLYVLPEARGTGLGRTLAERAIAEAQAKRYERVRLDTHRPSMAAAISLYRKLGFVEIPPYGTNPDGQFAFFEKRLSE